MIGVGRWWNGTETELWQNYAIKNAERKLTSICDLAAFRFLPSVNRNLPRVSDRMTTRSKLVNLSQSDLKKNHPTMADADDPPPTPPPAPPTLFECVIRDDFDGMVRLYATAARDSAVSYAAFRRWKNRHHQSSCEFSVVAKFFVSM